MEYPIAECNWKHIVEDDVHEWNRRVLQHVYGDHTSSVELSLENLDDYINFQLESAVASAPHVPPTEGRLGPDHVMFDISSNVGSLVIDKDRLGVSSQSNFSSIRANCCVYKGRWQYELMLGSKGVMQVGWATVTCKFSQEKGVGDTSDSYSFDGNRVQKWNGVTAKYGEPWLAGDIIGCTIDLDQGKVHFYRNGCWMGEAFNNVRLGPGLAYFPAVSLVFNENLVANFGALPFRYPVEGFLPLESVPHVEMIKAEKLLIWLERFLPFYDDDVDSANRQLIPEHHGWMRLPERGKKASMLLLVTPLVQHLGPLLMSAYITEASLLNFLFKICHIEPKASGSLPDLDAIKRNTKVRSLLDITWTLMDSSEVGQCLENLIVSLLTGYRFSLPTADFYHQQCYLLLVLVVLQHENTCQYLLQNVLFDKTKFPMFMEVKPLDNGVLEEMVPVIWYETSGGMMQDSEFEEQKKGAYKASYNRLSACVSQLKEIQDQILVQLFRSSNNPSRQSCRSIFLSKFREFLKENSGGARVPMVHLCPLSVALAFFHRLMVLLRNHLEVSCEPRIDSTNLVVPTEIFYNGTVNYCDIHRIGGLISHLQKQYVDELKEALRFPKSGVEDMDTSDQAAPPVCHSDSLLPPRLESYKREKDDYEVMIELLDSIIKLYVISAHRQLEKMCSLRESMQDYIMALRDLDSRSALYEDDSQVCLERAREVFLKKLAEQARHLAWVCAVIYSPEAREDIHWLLHITLRTLDQASSCGPFFAFVPDFYVEACIKSCNALRSFFSIALPVEDLPDWDETLVQFGSFLANNFANARIVNADLKDSLVQAFASFVCHPSTLRALESMSLSTQQTMVRALLQPYENRAWAQSNWILVRLWKGCGFAFRYTVPPHLGSKGKQQNEDFVSNHHRPCPSPLFQRQVAQWLWENPDSASGFLSSILNQLNWAFSEFIGMLQEIQNATNRPERVFIDSRQLKICATCFDLALALLRVLEMVISLQPDLFTCNDRPSTEILLTRLCQLICQVLNRVTSRSGCFELVVNMDIPGLETVHHFPILAAVAGIILSLTNNGSASSRESAIKAFLAEPSFQSQSLDFLLPVEKGTASTSTEEVFSFDNFSEVSCEEKEQFRQVTNVLRQRHKQVQQEEENSIIDEESLCTICYANPKSATFLPCAHESCRSCISLHLLHQRDCFFCKSSIERVMSATGDVIYPTAQVSK